MRRGLLLAPLAVGAALWWFYRDPARQAPEDRDLILSPADGQVVLVERTESPRWLDGPAWRIAIFLRLWDVHVQRAPIQGQVRLLEQQAGGHRPAFEATAATNAGHWLGIESAQGKALLLRTAGLVARRVTTSVQLGEHVRAGQRVGRILFGSRAELYLPATAEPLVRPGMVVRAGETVIARWSKWDAD